ncbi:MAG: hypothetical protein ACR2MG_01245 [Pyrinomonadaceae bacterium]
MLPKNTRYSRVALGYDADDKIRYVTAFARHSEYNQSAVAAAPREVRVVSTTATAGQTVSVMINVDAMGDESVYGFSLNYDTTNSYGYFKFAHVTDETYENNVESFELILVTNFRQLLNFWRD